MRTVRYENKVWNIDVEKNVLFLENEKKKRTLEIDIDEVFDLLSDKDQNKIAEQFAEGNPMTDEEMQEAMEESSRLFDKDEDYY